MGRLLHQVLLSIFRVERYVKVKQNCFKHCDIKLLQFVFLDAFAQISSIVTYGMLRVELWGNISKEFLSFFFLLLCVGIIKINVLVTTPLSRCGHTYKMRVLAQWETRGQQPSEKKPPAPSPQTKASEKVLGAFFGRLLPPLFPTVFRTLILYVCVCVTQTVTKIGWHRVSSEAARSVINMRGCALH